MDGLTGRMEMSEERISEITANSKEMRQSKAYREKQLWKIYRASWDFDLIPYGLVFRQLQS